MNNTPPTGYRFARMNEMGTHAVCKHGNIIRITTPAQPCLWTVLVKMQQERTK